MNEPRFFVRADGLSARAIGEMTGAIPARETDDLARMVVTTAALEQAGPRDLAFFDNPKYAQHLADTRAGVCLTSARFAEAVPAGTVVLVAKEPFRAFVAVARALFPDALRPAAQSGETGIAPGAFVHPEARLEAGVIVEPGATVGPHAEIGSGTLVGPGAAVGQHVRVGRNCVVGAGATVTHALIGDRVIIHPGCRIGQDGFGYLHGPRGHEKVPQTGRVIIQDAVEIGANTTIDRGAGRDTVIGEGTKIDNLVQVGHNTVIGRHCILVSQTGLSGSTTLEDYVVLGARVGTNNHVTIGEGAQIAAISVVNDDVPAGSRWGGVPAKPVKMWFREMKVLEQLAKGGRQGSSTVGSSNIGTSATSGPATGD